MTQDRRADEIRLADILSSIRRIRSFTHEGEVPFAKSPVIQDAVIRNLEVIGEAAGKISDPLRRRYPVVPWSKMRGFASFAKHEYWRVTVERLWDTVQQLPAIEAAIAGIEPDRRKGESSRD